jgi:AcrR family transcriptional regulator
VSAPAAYRHFVHRDRFLAAVGRRCREMLGRHMLAAQSAELSLLDDFKATGRASIQFAISNPELADCAFAVGPDDTPDDPDTFRILVNRRDALTNAGMLPKDRREGAEIVTWSSVHGISMLLAKSSVGATSSQAMVERVLLGIGHALGFDHADIASSQYP